MLSRVRQVVGSLNTGSGPGPSLMERWEWQESHAKYVINSVRVYEFWGYSWWLPLWDHRIMHAWHSIPGALREGKGLYKTYVEGLTQEASAKIPRPATGFNKVRVSLLNLLGIRRWIKRACEYERHPLAWYGIMPKRTFRRLYDGNQSIATLLALEWIGLEDFQ